jgi:tetratricopeptide (TPR) repeat protein
MTPPPNPTTLPVTDAGMRRTFLRFLRAGVWRVGTTLLALVLSAPCADAGSLEAGLALYRQDLLPEALPLLEQAVAERPDDPEALDWLAETQRRVGREAEAVATAKRALALRPLDSFAHTVLGDAYNPQLSSWEGTDQDSCLWHLRRAVACDSTQSEAWLSLWLQGLRLGERDLERRALRQIVAAGFLTQPLMNYSRWLLRTLPDSAILLVNGDMDTYPTVALQETEGLRPDVAVVNLPLLNLDWYRRLIRARGVPVPFDEPELGALESQLADESRVSADRQMVRGWLTMQRDGRLTRPLVVAVTVGDLEFYLGSADRLTLMGGFWQAHPESARASVDTAAVRSHLMTLEPRDLAGPWVGAQDRSPIRLASSERGRNNPVFAGFEWARALRDAGQQAAAHEALLWTERFAREVAATPDALDRLEELRQSLERER